MKLALLGVGCASAGFTATLASIAAIEQGEITAGKMIMCGVGLSLFAIGVLLSRIAERLEEEE